MNELSTEQMEERIRNVKVYCSKFFTHEEHRDQVIIIGAGQIHSDLLDRLQNAADQLNSHFGKVTVMDIEKLAATTSRPVEDILVLIENLPRPASKIEGLLKMTDNNKLADAIPSIKVLDHDDNRPWYEKAANLGGKKRKQNYHNRQPWRK
jgi:hypothetical protein